MTVSVTITSVTNPIGPDNQTAVAVAGTVDVSTTAVAVRIVDSAATAVTGSGTVVGTGWTLSANVSTLADGILTVTATATDLSSTQAFAATSVTKITAPANYITRAELKAYIKDGDAISADNAPLDASIATASRAVDAHCGRHFYQAASAVRYFTAINPCVLLLEDWDLLNTTGLTVEIDRTGLASYEAFTDFVPEPRNGSVGGVGGWPFTRLRAGRTSYWPCHIPAGVKIAGNWGWTAVPEPVKQATKMLAAMHYFLGSVPLNIYSVPDIGALRVRESDTPGGLLRPYAKSSGVLVR